MLLTGKAAWAVIIFILLTTGPRDYVQRRSLLGANLSKEVPAVRNRNDCQKDTATVRQRIIPRGG